VRRKRRSKFFKKTFKGYGGFRPENKCTRETGDGSQGGKEATWRMGFVGARRREQTSDFRWGMRGVKSELVTEVNEGWGQRGERSGKRRKTALVGARGHNTMVTRK